MLGTEHMLWWCDDMWLPAEVASASTGGQGWKVGAEKRGWGGHGKGRVGGMLHRTCSGEAAAAAPGCLASSFVASSSSPRLPPPQKIVPSKPCGYSGRQSSLAQCALEAVLSHASAQLPFCSLLWG